MTWILHLYSDDTKSNLFKIMSFNTLNDIAYCLNKELYEVSNFYHQIKKPNGIFKYLDINKQYKYKSIYLI